MYSCATFKERQEPSSSENFSKNNDVEKRIYLLGNIYNPTSEASQNTLNSLHDKLVAEDENSMVIFLGNYIKPEKNKTHNKKQIDNQLEKLLKTLDGYKGETLFIPGYYDWNVEGLKGLHQQEKFIDKHLGKKAFLPEDGCPIKSMDLSDDIALIIVDAQWYIANWDLYPTINENCEIDTRSKFIDEFSDQIKKARGKTTIVAISRPIFSHGKYGGSFSFKSNLSPLPIIGNIKNVFRTTGGFDQKYLSNNNYTSLIQRLETLSKQNENVVFVSAHENNLQYIIDNKIPQIISGSVNTTEAVKKTRNTIYSHATQGYAVLDIYKDGSSKVSFVSTEKKETEFQAKVFDGFKTDNAQYPILKEDSIKASILTQKETHKNFFYRMLWGNRYRKYYGLPLEMPVAYLDTLQGGVYPLRQGGGHQSVSLHLENNDGKRFVMRAMKKNSAQYMQAVTFRNVYMQDELEGTVAENLVQDFFTGSYPYSILLAEGLSKQVEIPTQNSNIYYIPKQSALGNFNKENGDKLYVFEDHPTKGDYQLGTVKFDGKAIDTYEMLRQIHKDESIKIDQKSFAKARLFDMLIGDWDRHEDQWKWLQYHENGNTIYRPLPRDRDQAFSKMGDGLLVHLATFFVPPTRIIRSYSGNLKDVRDFNLEPFPLDVNFLCDLTEEDWQEQVKYLQQQLPDSVIDEVFAKMPKELKGKDLSKIKEFLKERRENLPTIAHQYYERVAKYAIVTGTDKDDYFRIEILRNRNVEVSVYRKKDGTYKDRFHHRVFSPKETREIWLYGLDDDDTFEVIGQQNSIKIILVGGQNNDNYIVKKRNKVHIYDFKSKKNDVAQAKGKAQIKLKDQYERNTYNYENVYENNFQMLPTIAANQDVGAQIGLIMQQYHKGFKGKISHMLNTSYYTSTSGLTFNYTSNFPEVIGRFNLQLNAYFNNENYTVNYFGMGNETVNHQDSIGRNPNRIPMEGYSLTPILSRGFPDGSSVRFGFKWYNIQVQDSDNLFATNQYSIPDYLFKSNNYLNLQASYSYKNQDFSMFPTNGFNANFEAQYVKNLNQHGKEFLKLLPSLAIDYKLIPSGKLVLATKINGSIIIGEGYEFFQASFLGGDNGLRGFRNQRYTGKNSFVQSTDLRWSFNRGHTFIIPARMGLYAGFDYGRVWEENDQSSFWHNAYGGGLFLIFAESVTANFGAFNTEEGFQMMFTTGFSF